MIGYKKKPVLKGVEEKRVKKEIRKFESCY